MRPTHRLGVAAAALAIGCGGGGPPTADRQLPPAVGTSVTAAVKELQRAFAARDYGNLCALLTAQAQEQAGYIAHQTPTTCVRDVRRVVRTIADAGGWSSTVPQIVAVAGRGRKRTVTLETDGRRTRPRFVRERGRWRMDGFLGVAESLRSRTERTSRAAPFPAAASEEIRAREASAPCRPVSSAAYPTLEGGCRLTFNNPKAEIEVQTLFGAFLFGECDVSYTVRVEPDGRTWTEALDVEGPRATGCSDVKQCDVPRRALSHPPWKGRLRPDGPDGYLHVAQACFRTCVGDFVGRYVTRLVPHGTGWRIRPTSMGDVGLTFADDLSSRGDGALELR
jgi:hypothetical protein